jgi:hypothetical protein
LHQPETNEELAPTVAPFDDSTPEIVPCNNSNSELVRCNPISAEPSGTPIFDPSCKFYTNNSNPPPPTNLDSTQRGQPVGYAFDPVPKSLRRDPRLKLIDRTIVAILISLAIWRRDSCWTSMRYLASQVPAIRRGKFARSFISAKTAQRSIKRLMTFGYLRREAVPVPDPDDPRNATGFRYYFLWHPDQAVGGGD